MPENKISSDLRTLFIVTGSLLSLIVAVFVILMVVGAVYSGYDHTESMTVLVVVIAVFICSLFILRSLTLKSIALIKCVGIVFDKGDSLLLKKSNKEIVFPIEGIKYVSNYFSTPIICLELVKQTSFDNKFYFLPSLTKRKIIFEDLKDRIYKAHIEKSEK